MSLLVSAGHLRSRSDILISRIYFWKNVSRNYLKSDFSDTEVKNSALRPELRVNATRGSKTPRACSHVVGGGRETVTHSLELAKGNGPHMRQMCSSSAFFSPLFNIDVFFCTNLKITARCCILLLWNF